MTEIERQVAALGRGDAFARAPGRHVVRVGGPEAVRWLHDLVTADVVGLPVGGGRRSFLLTPTGRIRADLWLLRRDQEVVLVQRGGAGQRIDLLLAPYVLTSEVTLVPDPGVEILALPTDLATEETFAPSAVGGGIDALVPAGPALEGLTARLLGEGRIEAGPEAQERLRVLRGAPEMGVDFDESSLPAEVGVEEAISQDKGCFLGQESVARIRNLGHPPTVLRHLRIAGHLAVGNEVMADGAAAGAVTSACPEAGDTVVLVRVTWAWREAALQASDGRPLHPAAMTA